MSLLLLEILVSLAVKKKTKKSKNENYEIFISQEQNLHQLEGTITKI